MEENVGPDYVQLASYGDKLTEAAVAKNDNAIAKIVEIISKTRPSAGKMSEEVRAWIEESVTSEFHLSQLRDEFHIRDISGKRNLRQIIKRLKEEGLISQGERPGLYIREDDELVEMQWWDASLKDIPIKLPFTMHEYVKIFPGNIIVFAGEPNSGKTAAVLRMIVDNLNNKALYKFYEKHLKKQKHPEILFNLFNCEASASEMKQRWHLFDDVDLDDLINKCCIYERQDKFHTVIKPNAINFVDYLEMHDNFFLISKYLSDIHKKLEDGICIVNLQKDKDKEFGEGKGRGLQKPRLYCTFGNGSFTIVKAKSWRTGKNPNYLGTTFKLVQGNIFIYSPLVRVSPQKVKK